MKFLTLPGKMSKQLRVCIIGCGPSGMSALYQFSKIPEKDRSEIVCYEKQAVGVVSGMLRGKRVSFISLNDFKTTTYTYILSKNKMGYIYYICLLNV